jgi:hypothetical protein
MLIIQLWCKHTEYYTMNVINYENFILGEQFTKDAA